jgi:small subunit ribosomal protein S7
MSRRHAAEKRKINKDPKYGSLVVSKFINSLMWDGKRSLAESIFYQAVGLAEGRAKKDGIEIFSAALDNVRPALEVRSRRVGGATYQVPSEVRQDRAQALAIRWLINSARARSEKTMTDRLCGEMLDASEGRGSAVKKREDTHKMAEANRAFAHFRW